MAGSMQQDAILGIVFGAIFGVLFLAVCVISAVKAVKDRKKIKARIAERQRLKRNIQQEYDIVTEPTSLNSVNSVNSTIGDYQQLQLPYDRQNRNGHNYFRSEMDTSSKTSPAKPNENVHVEMNQLSNGGCDDLEMVYSVSMSSMSSGKPLTSHAERSAVSQPSDHTDNLSNGKAHLTVDQPVTETTTKIDDSLSRSNAQRVKSASAILDTHPEHDALNTNQTHTNYRNKAWESSEDDTMNKLRGVGSTSQDNIEVLGIEKSSSGPSNVDRPQWRDKTYFGTRPGAREMSVGVYRFLGESASRIELAGRGHCNAAFE